MAEPGLSQDAKSGMDASPVRFGIETNGRLPSGIFCGDAFGTTPGEVATIARPEPLSAMEAPALSHTATGDRISGPLAGVEAQGATTCTPASQYSSPGDCKSLEAFGALPCRTVANAVSDAPIHTASRVLADRSIEPRSGGDGESSPPPASRNAPSRNTPGPLSTSINSITTLTCKGK